MIIKKSLEITVQKTPKHQYLQTSKVQTSKIVESLVRHGIGKNGELVQDHSYMCDKCPFSTKMKQNLKEHVLRMHSSKSELQHSCDHCSFKTYKKYDLKRHEWKAHGIENGVIVKPNRPLRTCPHCSETFDRFHAYSEHIKIVHENQILIECDQCSHKFKTQNQLNKHIRNFHHPYLNCDICGKKIANKFSMRKHKAKFHNVLPENSFKCDMCPVFFRTEKYLQSHIKNEHDNK